MNLDDFQKTCHQLKRPLLVISGKRGCLTCGYLSMASFERNQDAAAIVRGVDTYQDMLEATVQEVSSHALELGVKPGMTGRQALELFQ
ncbi:MAG: YunC family protein [Planctomycetales bacterium]|nr:YunC family protein [Planctomycetales bacterium]